MPLTNQPAGARVGHSMPSDFSHLFDWMLYGGKEVLAGLILIALLLFLTAGPQRRKIRWSVMFLALYLILLGLRLLFPPDTPIRNTLKFFALFLLFSSLGLSVFLLLTS